MRIDSTSSALAGRLLLAMPGATESAFRKSVVLVCAHSEGGAMGLVINRSASGLTLRRLLGAAGDGGRTVRLGVPVHEGGPTDAGRAILLHSPDDRLAAASLAVTPTILMNARADALWVAGGDTAPARVFVAQGCCGWGAGQLDREVRSGAWLTMAAADDLVFAIPLERRWPDAMSRIGVTPAALSAVAGHA
jgi:putative transcriptional regulator